MLPDSISQLSLLQKLDLYSNKLSTLPLTFWQLKKLKWLDLRNNNLETRLAEAAGPCVNEKECKQCASRVRNVKVFWIAFVPTCKYFTRHFFRFLLSWSRSQLNRKERDKQSYNRKEVRNNQCFIVYFLFVHACIYVCIFVYYVCMYVYN